MIAIRKFGYSALILAAFVGCAEEQPAAPPAPATPTETKAEPTDAKPAPAPETTPAEKAAPAPDMPKVEGPQSSPAPKEEAKPEGSAAAVSLEPEEIAAIKKLPADDANAALKQLVCPVSGEHLGSMDVPVKVTALGQSFFLCCKGCNKDVKDNPAEVVAKLKK
jgi:hypothetical protein